MAATETGAAGTATPATSASNLLQSTAGTIQVPGELLSLGLYVLLSMFHLLTWLFVRLHIDWLIWWRVDRLV